jgi:hypothetical protein
MMTALEIRNERLAQLSQMVINGHIFHKLDNIATIFINTRFYFNVFRRYNSPYNIVLEDYNGDIHLHQDHTVRTSLKTVLCLPDFEASNIYTSNATSYKHNGPVLNMDKDIADMRWSEIHTQYHAINVNFGGIFYSEPPILNYPADVKQEVPPSTPRSQIIPPPIECPNAPSHLNVTDEDMAAAKTLLTLSIPQNTGMFVMSESDGPTLSMRFADIIKGQRIPVCYCEMDDEDDYSEDESIDENNYTVLRSGSMIPKANIY